MSRRALALVAALLLAAPAALAEPQPAAPSTPGPPAPVSLDGGGWQLHHDGSNRGLAAGWSAGGPRRGWTRVTVPSTIDAKPLAKYFSGTVAWYRLRFEGPPASPGYGWALQFDQVRRKSVVWLNGHRLGSHNDPYTPFQIDATGLRRGANELVVRVDSRKGDRPHEGWWNWGGILRPVTLVPVGRLSLRNLGLLPSVRCSDSVCHASVRLTGTIHNRTSSALGGEIDVKLTAPDGSQTSATVPVRRLARTANRGLSAQIPVDGTPALWSPASPQLYDARVTLRAGQHVEQDQQLRIGLRSVSVRGGQLYLNDKPIKMYGAAIQEDFPGHGAALTPADDDQIVAELKELGANATRAHYPLNEDLLSKLDAAGIMVWNEAPIYHQNQELNRASGRRAALETVRGTILATRNHPSVIINSVANEPVSNPDSYPGSSMWLRSAARLARRVDPSRPVAVDILSYPNVPFQKTYAAFDVIGVNNYYGWYVGKPSHPTGNFLDLDPYLKKLHRFYPTQALVMTEYGAESTRSGLATTKGTYEFQSDYINRTLDVVEGNSFMNGALYWTLREFAVKPDWLGGIDPALNPYPDAIHRKGLISYDGVKKPAFSVLQQRIAQVLGSTP